MIEDDQDRHERLEHLLELGIDPSLPPEMRLLMAVLVRATLDYFDADPVEQRSAAEYFLGSWLYRVTLEVFGLPPDYLPEEITIAGLVERSYQLKEMGLDPELLRMKTLAAELTGTQLKVILTMGTLTLPATVAKIAAGCQLSRSATIAALLQLQEQGLAVCQVRGQRQYWLLPPEMAEKLTVVYSL